jgi:hypothetical protein
MLRFTFLPILLIIVAIHLIVILDVRIVATVGPYSNLFFFVDTISVN